MDAEQSVGGAALRLLSFNKLSGFPGYVNGEFNGSHVLLVGEAPGAEEDKLGVPFCGKSGQLLWDTIKVMTGLQRRDFDIVNVYPWKLKDNDMKNADPSLLAMSVANLRSILENYKVVVLLGGTALQHVLNMDKISARRGSVYGNRHGTRYLASLHPAAVLYSPSDKLLFMHDMHRLGTLAHDTYKSNCVRNVYVVGKPMDAGTIENVVAGIGQTGQPYAVDIEAERGELACVGFSDQRGLAFVFPTRTPAERDVVAGILRRDFPKVFHNATYDLAFLKHRCGIDVGGEIHDTLAMHQVYRPEYPRSLGVLTSLYTSQPYYKDMYVEWFGSSRTAADYATYYRYNGLDVSCTIELFEVLSDKLRKQGLWDVYEAQRKMIRPAVEMSLLGLRYDDKRAAEIVAKIEGEITRWQRVLDGRAGKPVNVFSPPQVASLLYDDLKLSAAKGRSTSEKDLMSVYAGLTDRRARKILRALFALRHRRKFLSSYLRNPTSPDGRVRSSFNPHGTDTGRWSASKFLITEGLNLQTIPKKFKECFIADEGQLLWMADYSQIEARFVAYLANDKAQIALFNTPGGDIHRLNAARLFGKDPKDITDQEREVAKRCVHALNYGIGPETLMKTVNRSSMDTGFTITLDMARRVREIYLTEFKDIVAWQQETWRKVCKDRRLTNPFGRMRHFTGSTKDERTRNQALAFIPQSTVPDMMNQALLLLRGTKEVQVALQIHDALGGWGPKETVATWVPTVLTSMDIPVPFPSGVCRVPVEMKVGERWSQLRKV